MLSIEATMLVTLGFLLAMLLGLALVPVYRKRVERLTTHALRSAMPLTDAEIRADKDRLRAGYAIEIHDLEERNEKATLIAARQKVEINRRDGIITELRGEAKRQSTILEEHENARRVLEQTIMDRLPKVEQRLAEAKKLLLQRDREISRLSETADRQRRALEETTQINTQNRDEIHRLQAALTTRAARNREGMGDPRFDSEVALRTEVEALRAKTRDQEQMISRLQALVSRAGGVKAAASALGEGVPTAGRTGSVDDEIIHLRKQLTDAEASLRSVQADASGDDLAARRQNEAAIRQLKAEIEDQDLEINRLRSSLKAYQESERKDTALAEGKMAMKSRIAALQSQTEGQATTIMALRAEVAATNERLARQASHYISEMRKLGAGSRSPGDVQRLINGSNGNGGNGVGTSGHDGSESLANGGGLTLTDRITEPRSRVTTDTAAGVTGGVGLVSGHGNGNGDDRADAENDLETAGAALASDTGASGNALLPQPVESLASGGKARTPARSGGLLERITRLDRGK